MTLFIRHWYYFYFICKCHSNFLHNCFVVSDLISPPILFDYCAKILKKLNKCELKTVTLLFSNVNHYAIKKISCILCSISLYNRVAFMVHTGTTGIPQIARFLGKSLIVLTENRVNQGGFYYIKSKMGKSVFKSPLFVTFWRKLTFFLWIFIKIMNHNQIPLVSFDSFVFRAIEMR